MHAVSISIVWFLSQVTAGIVALKLGFSVGMSLFFGWLGLFSLIGFAARALVR